MPTSLLLRPTALALGVLLGAASAWGQPGDGPLVQQRDSMLYQGLSFNPTTESLLRFRIWNSGSVEFEEFDAQAASEPDFSDISSLSDPINDFVTNYITLNSIVELYISKTSIPIISDFVSMSFANDHIRLRFDKGVPIWAFALLSSLLVIFGGVTVGLTLLIREKRRRQAEAAARQRALFAREAERSRIAREIHDGPLQDVHALRLLPEGSDREVVNAESTRIARELRAIAEGLRPPALGRFGLAAALSAHTNRVKERYPSVAIRLELDEDGTGPNALPDIVRSALFRVVQESITNAIEHGGADRVRVQLKLPDEPRGEILIDIADDGKGFSWTGSAPDYAGLADGGHFGLVGMFERAEAIGGRLVLSSGGLDGRGATVRVTVPDMRASGASSRPNRRRLTPA